MTNFTIVINTFKYYFIPLNVAFFTTLLFCIEILNTAVSIIKFGKLNANFYRLGTKEAFVNDFVEKSNR